MSARVHALLVVRPEGRTSTALHLKRTLAALDAQTRNVDILTIVLCGDDRSVTEIAASSRAEAVISVAASTSYAHALRVATSRLAGDAVWLLAQDTAPEPTALARLAGALELSPSISIAAPKLVDSENRTQIVSLGVSMSNMGRAVELVEDELDQGQHDVRADAMSADIRGLLVRSDVWRALGGIDPALAGADEGLDLGVRARLAGGRVELVPRALVSVAGDGVAGVPAPHGRGRVRRRVYAERVAQLHRRLVYAPPAVVVLQWLVLLPVAVWRAVMRLLAKQPARIMPEWAATIVVAVRWLAIARARARIRHTRTVSWARLASLRVGREQLRERLDIDPDETGADEQREDLRFFAGGGAWIVLAALIVSVGVFPALLAWPVLGGGALAPLRENVLALWSDTLYGLRASGFDAVAPADPFAAVIAILGSLWPGDPSRAVVALWLLALPLAVLGGWFAATRLTSRSYLRIVAGLGWALAPTFLAALVEGRPTGVLVHLLLPWLFYAGSVAHRSWTAAGAASLLAASIAVCAPSLIPALVALWMVALVLTIVVRGGRGAGHFVWTIVPTVAAMAPVVWVQVRAGNVWAIVADPGMAWAGPALTADPAGRLLAAAGFPSTDPGGWGEMLAGWGLVIDLWWVPLLVAPLGLLALLAPLTPRWLAGIVLVIVGVAGLATAMASIGVSVATTQGEPVSLWTGTALSVAWLGAVGAATLTLDAGFVAQHNIARTLSATVVLSSLVVLSVPALTAVDRGSALLTNGPTSTLPAYVAAQGREDANVGTIILTPLADGSVATDVVWGGSETIGSQSTVIDTRATATPADERLAVLTSDLVTATTPEAIEELAAAGIGFVLLAPATDANADATRSFRLLAETSLDQRDDLDAVGETSKGALWRVTTDVTERASAPAAVTEIGRLVALGQIVTVAVALLLAIPTSASRRQSRRSSRIVGPHVREES